MAGARTEIPSFVAHPGLLCFWCVDTRSRREAQGELTNVPDDGDDFDLHRRIALDRHAPADRILRAEVGASKRLVDGNDGRRAIDITSIERTAGDERHTNRSEVVDADDAELGQGAGRARCIGQME